MQDKILSILSYFDVFDHPMHEDELKTLSDSRDISGELSHLIQHNLSFHYEGYYSLNPKVEELVSNRLEKEKVAQYYFKKLPSYAKLIKSFPFVRAVAISGSLSKNVMHQDGDIDYFIITSANRLWICRTLLILFKKVFLLNSRKYFCVNYFIDENNLEIRDHNIFTAVEISYLIPVYNKDLLDHFRQINNWVDNYFPKFNHPSNVKNYQGSNLLKKTLESILGLSIWDRLDLYLMKLTHKRWSKKFGHFDADKLELTMRTNRGISKHHPRDFQNRVLASYQKNLEKISVKNEGIIYS